MLAVFMAVACIGCDISRSPTFQIQAQLQALYEQMAETVSHLTLSAGAAAATDVLVTPDWVFIDASGQRQSMPQARAGGASTLRTPSFDTITNVIQKVTVSGDQATVIVKVAVATDAQEIDRQAAMLGQVSGWQEIPDLELPKIETTTFRDTWVKSGESWKMKTREQVGKPDVRAASANVY
jgi:hypothetical protein